MTYIGQNIKKIRSAIRRSQTDFATIFSLSRGSVGANEEGRAEPKIDTIIQIANLFYIELPIKLKGTLRAFELNGSEMEYDQNGLHHGDVPLCQLSPDSTASVEIANK